MPTRTVQRWTTIDVQELYTRLLRGQTGWGGGSAEDIQSIKWDAATDTLTFIQEPKGNSQRRITFSASEVWDIVKALPAWAGSTVADVEAVTVDAAGRKITIVRAPEVA